MASSSDVVRARIDGHIKEEATNVLAGMGLSVSDAIRVLLTRIAADKALPVRYQSCAGPTRHEEATSFCLKNSRTSRLGPDCMDRIQQLNYEKDFRIAFLESKGDGFQRLFEKLMSKAHPNDFMACRPWGNVGDRKNDGYLPSARTLFQSYAPNELSAADAIKKINEDFEGAKEHWEEHFDEWTFVHNAPDGRLGPHIIEALAKLKQDNPKIKIGHCGYEEMLAKFRQLSLEDLESWFGPSLTMEANVNLGFGDLAAVLTHISITPSPRRVT